MRVESIRVGFGYTHDWCPVPVREWPKGKVPASFTSIEDVRNELRGKDLACRCPVDDGQPCHADVLLEWANS